MNDLKALKEELVLHKAFDFETGGKAKITAIFIHGIAADSGSFRKFFGFLRESNEPGLRIVAYDLLGVGGSPRGESLNYGLAEQMEAIINSLSQLEVLTPVVLVGHSMGTMLVPRLAEKYSRIGKGMMIPRGASSLAKESRVGLIERIVLISPPVYTTEDIRNPLFKVALKNFRNAVAEHNKDIVKSDVFKNEIRDIVSNPDNINHLKQTPVPTSLIYGKYDKIIAAFNYPKLLAENSLIQAICTPGPHGVTPDKFSAIIDNIKGKQK